MCGFLFEYLLGKVSKGKNYQRSFEKALLCVTLTVHQLSKRQTCCCIVLSNLRILIFPPFAQKGEVKRELLEENLEAFTKATQK